MKKTINLFKSSNLSLRLLSIVLSICLWMIVINTNDPVTTRTFSNVSVFVQNQNILTDEGKVFRINEGDKISFSIRGKKSIVDKLKKSDFDVFADLSELSSVNAVPIRIVAKKYANSIDIMYANDKMMVLHIEDSKTIEVPVSVDLKGTPAEGFSVGNIEITPKTIEITGPSSEIERIKHAKVPINIKGAQESVIRSGDVICYDSVGNKLDSSVWEFSTKRIKVHVIIGQSKKVPVKAKTKGQVEEGYQIAAIEYSPSKVTLSGSAEGLSTISEIELPVISVKNANATITKEVPLSSIKLPKSVNFIDPNQVIQIKILINKEANQEMKISSEDIDVNGLKDDMKLSFDDDSVILTLSGDDNELSLVKAQDFHPSIDVSGLDEGRHKVTLKLDQVSGVTVKGSPQISITIEKADDNSEDE